MDKVRFTAMKDGDARDYAFPGAHEHTCAAGTAAAPFKRYHKRYRCGLQQAMD